MDIIRSEKDEYILIPHLARLKAIEQLEKAGIPYTVLSADDIPGELSQVITFKGKQFSFPKVQCIIAPVDSKEFIKDLEGLC